MTVPRASAITKADGGRHRPAGLSWWQGLCRATPWECWPSDKTCPPPRRWGEGRVGVWAGQALAVTLVASLGKTSACGAVRLRCQKPNRDRIRNRAAAPKATKAETSMIWPICHQP